VLHERNRPCYGHEFRHRGPCERGRGARRLFRHLVWAVQEARADRARDCGGLRGSSQGGQGPTWTTRPPSPRSTASSRFRR
jgi:hypothetical protein